MTPEQRDKHVKTIEKIENLPRPAKWREIKKFVLTLHPELRAHDKDFMEACKELRDTHVSKTGSSKSGTMRNTMKIPNYVYDALVKLDPGVRQELGGGNHGDQKLIMTQLYKAFPEYRVSRTL